MRSPAVLVTGEDDLAAPQQYCDESARREHSLHHKANTLRRQVSSVCGGLRINGLWARALRDD
jgi:hypothetical protein